MKEIVWRYIDAVWFEIELFKVKDFHDFAKDLDAAQGTEFHRLNETFTVSTSRDACFLAESLLTRDDEYNYALVYLCRYNEKPEMSEDVNEEGIVDTRILIGDVYSGESEKDNG